MFTSNNLLNPSSLIFTKKNGNSFYDCVQWRRFRCLTQEMWNGTQAEEFYHKCNFMQWRPEHFWNHIFIQFVVPCLCQIFNLQNENKQCTLLQGWELPYCTNESTFPLELCLHGLVFAANYFSMPTSSRMLSTYVKGAQSIIIQSINRLQCRLDTLPCYYVM